MDMAVVGCNWIEVPRGKYSLRTRSPSACLTSRCQMELDVSFEDFVSHPAEGDWSKMAPFRILSLDIECAGRKGMCMTDCRLSVTDYVTDAGLGSLLSFFVLLSNLSLPPNSAVVASAGTEHGTIRNVPKI